MKKILALVLCLCTLFPMLVACGEADPTVTPVGTTAGATSTLTTPTPTTGATIIPSTPTPTASTKDFITENGIEIPLYAGTYEFKHTGSGNVIATTDTGELKSGAKNAYISVDWIFGDEGPEYRLGLFAIETVTHNVTKKPVDNYETRNDLTFNGTSLTTGRHLLQNDENLWVLTKNEDGTFYIQPKTDKNVYLTCVNGNFNVRKANKTQAEATCKWTITDKSLDNPYYLEYKSEDKHILMRLPHDVYDEDNYEFIRVKGQGKKKYVPTTETILEYANSIMDIKDEYTELCGFEPFNVIIIHAYNYLRYMACIYSDLNNNHVWINTENASQGPSWYYQDLQELQYRKDVLNLKDCGFVMLHEIGHMYDCQREWKFETEMQTDLKSAYFLYKHPEYVAAPSEFPPEEYMTGENVAEKYGKLGGSKMQASAADADPNYNIYRNAQINVQICEKLGWENLKATFHWFNLDPEGKNWKSQCNGDKMEMFYKKLQDFSGKDPLAMYDKVELKEVWKKIDKNHEAHLAERG